MLIFDWEGADIQPQIRPRQIPETTCFLISIFIFVGKKLDEDHLLAADSFVLVISSLFCFFNHRNKVGKFTYIILFLNFQNATKRVKGAPVAPLAISLI